MPKGLLAEWRRGMVAGGLAAAIGFEGGIGGRGGGAPVEAPDVPNSNPADGLIDGVQNTVGGLLPGG